MTAPSDELAARILGELRSLADAERRLAAHAAAAHHGLTPADPGTGEQWDSGQVWAHLAEFGGFWLPELELIVAGSGEAPVPFGRVKSDPHRIAEIERNRHAASTEQMAIVAADMARLAHRLASLTGEQWTRRGIHPTLGEMDLFGFLGHFLIGHYHEHADQLDLLAGAGR